MKNELKLRLKIADQQLTLWEIIRQEPTYVMFRASVTSGKKNPDGTWNNINQTFTCFASGDAMQPLLDNFVQKGRIKVSGSITMLPEKRSAVGKNGNEFQESIMSNLTLNVDALEFIEAESFNNSSESFVPSQKVANSDFASRIDDDIPF
jgi:hypothetical protein